MAVALAAPAARAPAAPQPRLPALRQDLLLLPGPRGVGGAPSWTLQDPAAHKFYRIGWLEFEVLSRWGLGTAEAVAAAVARETPLPATTDGVRSILRFLDTHDLLVRQTPADTEALLGKVGAGRLGPAKWLLKNYLFVRLKLLNPDAWLTVLVGRLGWALTPAALAVVAVTALLGAMLVLRQWDQFLAGLHGLATPQGIAMAAAAMGISHALHELGHGLAAKRMGCRVPAMGVAFMVLWPVLWTDTTEAWKLTSRRQRLLIDGAGMLAELTLAAVCSVAWALLPDGPLRAATHVLATVTWVTTLAVNLNPLMRFDGYYLMSDLLDVPNLQDRSFALARWWLRERLFGWGDPVPEAMPAGRRRMLIAYALGTWVYRFFLFLGIAFMVYHLAFKALGLFLMSVELWWFIIRPIGREIAQWAGRRHQIRPTRQAVRTAALLLAGIVLLILPWRGGVNAPAVLRAESQTVLFTSEPGRIVTLAAEDGLAVRAGDMLLRLEAPEVNHAVAMAEARMRELAAGLEVTAVDQTAARSRGILAGEYARAEAQLAAARARQAKLELHAPTDGRVTDVPSGLQPGLWLPGQEPVALVVGGAALVEAFVDEVDLARLRQGASARFVSDLPGRARLDLTVVRVDLTSVAILDRPELASAHGGPLAVHADKDGHLVPQGSLYRVLLKPVADQETPMRVEAGHVRIDADPESILVRLWRRYLAVLVRESGL